MLQPDAILGNYTVVRVLAVGGMAMVYEVEHRILGTRHALKVLQHRFADRPDQLLREGRIQASLRSEHVVPVYDVIDADGHPGLVMPLVPGCSLASLLAHHRPSSESGLELFRQVVEGVAAAHQAGIAHRDLKPGNVLLEVRPTAVVARVTDFGIAAQGTLDPLDPVRGAGTPGYAAPEQTERGADDPRCDLWALGVLLHELLDGELPSFDPDTGNGEPRTTSVEPFGELIRGLLVADPNRRLASIEALQERLPPPRPDAVRADGALAAAVTAASSLGAAPTFAASVRVSDASLPRHPNPFVGRASELARLGERLASHRCVTVVGPGGVGKTRTVVHLLREGRVATPSTVRFVDLSDSLNPAAVLDAIGQTVPVPSNAPDRRAALCEALARFGPWLLVLDNVEQVAEAVAALVREALERAPELRILCTSRAPMGVVGESVFRLGPMSTEDAQALFEARGHDQGISLEPVAQASTGQLLAELDHLPLAIELAAARLPLLSPQAILERLSDRFRLLANPARKGRLGSLHATLAWSWKLLATEEQAALGQMGVFEGGFSLHAAEAVVDVPGMWAGDLVQRLVHCNMVHVVRPDRFTLLQSIRSFVHAERPLEAPTRRRHATYFARWGVDQGLWERRNTEAKLPQAEFENLRAACAWTLEHPDGAATLRALLMSVVALSVRRRDLRVVEAWVQQAAQSYEGANRGGMALMAGEIAQHRSHVDLARRHFVDAVAAVDNGVASQERLDARLALLWHELFLGDPQAAEDLIGEVEAEAQELGDRVSQGVAWRLLGELRLKQARLDDARRALETSLGHLAGRAGAVEGAVFCGLGAIEMRRGHHAEAFAYFQRALTLARSRGLRQLEGTVNHHLALVHSARAEPDEAIECLGEALRTARALGLRSHEAYALRELAQQLPAAGQGDGVEEAAQAWTIANELGEPRLLMLLGIQRGIDRLRKSTTDGAEEELTQALARARKLGDTRWEALALGTLGDVALERQESQRARDWLNQAIALCTQRRMNQTSHWWARLAVLEVREGNAAAAQSALAKARTTQSPHEPRLMKALLHAAAAEVSAHIGDPEQAAHDLRIAEELAPPDARGPHPQIAQAQQAVRSPG